VKKTSLIHIGIVLLVAAVLTVSAPLGAAASPWGSHGVAQTSSTLFSFGRTGGNIRPFTIAIASNGQVVAMGPALGTAGHVRLSQAALKGLLKLAKAEKFSSLPDRLEGNHVLPDVASLYITVDTGSATKTVRNHGAHVASFDQLFAVLMAVAGASM